MIAFLEGVLVEAQPLRLVVDVAGVGYELHVPLSTSTQAGVIGDKIRLHTQLVVREDSHQLFGFASVREKTAFVALTEKVSGIGPKIALNILSRLTVDSLYSAIASGNVALLTQCPGIGKKTAERLVLELRDVFAKSPVLHGTESPEFAGASPNSRTQENALVDDAVAALVTLGFKQPDAQRRVEKHLTSLTEQPSVEVLIKKALNG